MVRSILRTALRNTLKEKQYALIKIGGLALGLGTTMVLMLYITNQLSFDKSHPDVERTYRINQTDIWTPAGGVFSSTGVAVAFALLKDFPEIESALRINTPGGQAVRYSPDGKSPVAFNEENVFAADSNFFSFFDFKLSEGDPNSALVGKNKVVISDKAAKRLFGDSPALGKLIQIGDDLTTVEVTGVTEAQPKNVHFHFDYLLSMHTNPAMKEFEWSWIYTQVVTYVKLRPGADVAALDSKLKTVANRHAPATFVKLRMDYNEFVKEKGAWLLYLQPVKDIHLYSASAGNRLGPVGDINYVYVLGIIAGFILLIAIVNFVNLSTARASKRAKEVGVKKTLGVSRSALIIQFEVEHILLTMVSMLLGLAVMEILRLLIQPFVGIEIPLDAWSPLTFALVIVGLPIVIGFLGGLYPAFYLTSFRPALVLKGRLMSGVGSSRLRNALVIFQFTISIALMAATIIVFQQLEFFRSRSVGFEKENLLVIRHAEKLGTHIEAFRQEISEFNGVESASVSNDIRPGMQDIFMREGDEKKVSISSYKVDSYFFETTKIPLSTGRTFDLDRPSDRNAVVISETTARSFGWNNDDAIGKKILYLGDELGPQEVIGVTKDFHFASLRQNIEPVMFFNTNSNFFSPTQTVLIRYNTAELSELATKIQSKWSQLVQLPFAYSLYDEEVKMQYKQEQTVGALFSIFTALSIIIAVTGLVGLVAYSAEQRKKEISIRKVFGASLGRIYIMINKQYVILLAISLLVATPFTWWIMQHWLDSFQYRIDINPLIFVVAGAIELSLSLLCVGYLALRAATANPSMVLKDE
ncbi:MAG: ABC transporter permease [Chryseolinea sp.]